MSDEDQSSSRVFTTPTWVRTPRQRDAVHDAPAPEQVLPNKPHATVPQPRFHPSAPHRSMRPPEQHRWKRRRPGRTLLTLVLLVCLAASIAGVVQIAQEQQTWAIFATLGCLLAAAVTFAVMASERPMAIELSGTTMTLTHQGGTHVVDLADPYQPVRLQGNPTERSWRLTVGTPDGDLVTLGPADVDAPVLDRIVKGARALAEETERRRRDKFGR